LEARPEILVIQLEEIVHVDAFINEKLRAKVNLYLGAAVSRHGNQHEVNGEN